MKVKSSENAASLSVNKSIQDYLPAVSEHRLSKLVEEIAVPRHFRYNAENNKKVADRIFRQFESLGYETHIQGSYSNVVAFNPNLKRSSAILIGAHFDSVPDCPGADDNASAVAAMLVCAEIVSALTPQIPVCFAAFNCEEDGLIGSTDFVQNYLSKTDLKIEQAHILEMIGYATDEPNTQSIPKGLPVKIPSVGNFLGVMGNQTSNRLVEDVLALGKTYLPELPVLGLKLYLGVEKLVPDLGRSDHLPFWEQKIPALMWTDTADFRNPNYHRATDTPDTLNYSFLKKATQLLLLQILNFSRSERAE